MAQTINQAIFEANIETRAQTLFTEQGYQYEPCETMEGIYLVFKPNGPEGVLFRPFYLVDLTAKTCNCPCHEQHNFCKHRRALEIMMEREQILLAGYEEREAAEHFDWGCDPYAEF